MQINKEFLKSLNPCADRYKHFLEHHGEFNGSLSEFMELPNVAYSDKVWVAEKVLTQNQAVSWATLCAESVVSIFEARYPKDKRLSNCMEFLKSVNDFNSLTIDQALEVRRHESAARAACVSSGTSGADGVIAARGASGASVFESAHAVHAAAYAATASHDAHATSAAVRSATCAANAAFHAAFYADLDSNKIAAFKNQEALNLQFLRMACSL